MKTLEKLCLGHIFWGMGVGMAAGQTMEHWSVSSIVLMVVGFWMMLRHYYNPQQVKEPTDAESH